MPKTRHFLLLLCLVAFMNASSQSITPRKHVFSPRENIVVEFQNLPDGAWISIAKPNDPVNKYVDYKYSKSSIGIVSFDPLDSYGEYEIRLYLTKDYILKNKQTIRLGNTDPVSTIKTVKNVYAPTENVQIEYSGLPGTSKDWIAIARAGIPETEYGDWEFTNGQQSGVVQFKSPGPSGNYEARVYYNNEKIVKARFPFRVGSEDTTIRLSTRDRIVYPKTKIVVEYSGMPGNAKDWISIAEKNSSDLNYITYKYTNGIQAGKIEFEGLEKGEYEIRAYINDEHTVASRYRFIAGNPDTILEVKTTRPVYKSNEEIDVFFHGFPGNAKDWISIAQKGSPDNNYIKYYYTGARNAFSNYIPRSEGLYSGMVSFNSQPPGTYEARGYLDGNYIVMSRFEFEVVPEKKDPSTVEICGKEWSRFLLESLSVLNEIISADHLSMSNIVQAYIAMNVFKNSYQSSPLAAIDNNECSAITELLRRELESYSETTTSAAEVRVPAPIIDRIKKFKLDILNNLNKKKIKCPKYLDITLIDEINLGLIDFQNMLSLILVKTDANIYTSEAKNTLREINGKIKLIQPCLGGRTPPDVTPCFSLLDQNKIREASLYVTDKIFPKLENGLAQSPCCCTYNKDLTDPGKSTSPNNHNLLVKTFGGAGEKVHPWIGYSEVMPNGEFHFSGSWHGFDSLYLPPGKYLFTISYPVEQKKEIEIKADGFTVVEIAYMGRLEIKMTGNVHYYTSISKLNEKGEYTGVASTAVNSSIDLPEGKYRVSISAPSGDIVKDVIVNRQATTVLSL